MLKILIFLILVAHGIGHSIGVAGGWGSNAWGGSGESWLLTPVLGRPARSDSTGCIIWRRR